MFWYLQNGGGSRAHPKIIGANVKITNKISKSQENANKYWLYGGYIKDFDKLPPHTRDFSRE